MAIRWGYSALGSLIFLGLVAAEAVGKGLNARRLTSNPERMAMLYSEPLASGKKQNSLELPKWVAQNSQAEEAVRLFQEGLKLLNQGTAESSQAAIEKFEAAIPLQQSTGERLGEAITRIQAGFAYDKLNINEPAETARYL